MRRPINTVNGTYKDPNLSYSAQDALNVIPMMTEKSGTRTVSQYRQAPGLKPFCRIGTNDGETVTHAGAGRGLRVVDNKLFAVAGRNLWQITASGVSVNYGTIPGVGRVSMAHNQRGLGNELAIDNGQSRYVFNTQTQDLQKVTDEAFPGSFKAVFIDGYIVYVEPQGRYFGHSDLSNALSYNSFDEYEAEGQPDRIVTAHESNRELLIFGQETTEAYVNSPSGSGEAPFVRATNTVIKSGCSARDSVCDVGLYTVYLDHNRTVQVLNGYTPVPISTAVIDSALQSCTKQQIANAYAFALESEGFQIYYLTVPGKFTFGYDFKNKEWHRRSSTGLDWWAVTDVVQWNGRWYALDSRRGDILELRWYDYPFDVQEELVREWVTGTISADQSPIFVNELELLFGCGSQSFTAVSFPDQPIGPQISGEAPGAFVGDAYSYAYTTTPGDSPIARTVLRPGSYIQSGAEQYALPHDGWVWDQSTATISNPAPTDEVVVHLEMRAFDQNGLYADHTDEFPISQEFFLLATGSSSSIGQPCFASTRSVEPESWVGIPQGTGADIQAGMPGWFGGRWMVAANGAARTSTDALASFASTPNTEFTAVNTAPSGGPDGFLCVASGGPTAFAKTAWFENETDGFESYEFATQFPPGTPFRTNGEEIYRLAKYVAGYYWMDSGAGGELVKTESLGGTPLFLVCDRTTSGNIVNFNDIEEFDGALYACCVENAINPRYQLRRSNDGGATWPDKILDFAAAETTYPFQLKAANGVLICISVDSGTAWTSEDDFATARSTGVLSNNNAGKGRYIEFASPYFFIVSGENGGSPGLADRCVTTTTGIEFSEPVALPIKDVMGIATDYVGPDDE